MAIALQRKFSRRQENFPKSTKNHGGIGFWERFVTAVRVPMKLNSFCPAPNMLIKVISTTSYTHSSAQDCSVATARSGSRGEKF